MDNPNPRTCMTREAFNTMIDNVFKSYAEIDPTGKKFEQWFPCPLPTREQAEKFFSYGVEIID